MSARHVIIGGTAYVSVEVKVKWYEAWPSEVALEPLNQYHGKRGKKGKQNKDWSNRP